jgi:hypothetical protein
MEYCGQEQTLIEISGNADALEVPAKPAPTMMTVPRVAGVSSALAAMSGATPKLMYPAVLRNIQATLAYFRRSGFTPASACSTERYLKHDNCLGAWSFEGETNGELCRYKACIFLR